MKGLISTYSETPTEGVLGRNGRFEH